MSLSHDNRQNMKQEPNETSSNIEPFLEMKSIKPYQSKSEYIYAMKRDLAKWFNRLYSFPAITCVGEFNELNAFNFVDELENGVLICLHANSIMKAAITHAYKFKRSDLKNANIINTARFRLFSSENLDEANNNEQNSAENLKKLLLVSQREPIFR